MKLHNGLIRLVGVVLACSYFFSPVMGEVKLLITGSDSKIVQPSFHRITAQKDWINLWEKHTGRKKWLFNSPQDIDFNKFMVAAIFEGKGINSSGIQLFSLVEEKDHITLRYKLQSYQTGSQPDLVTVYGFFVVPLSEKELVLEQDVQNLIGGSEVWKEKARFPSLK